MDVKQILPPPGAITASNETRDGEKRRQKGDNGKSSAAEKKPVDKFTVAPAIENEAQISPAESQLLDSKTVVDLLKKMTTPVAQAAATFSRHLSRRKPAASKAIVEKKLNRQA